MLALQAVALAVAGQVWAGITFDRTASTVTITHDADVNNAADSLYIVRPTIPVSSTLAPASPQQMNHTFGSLDGANSIAVGSLGTVTNTTTASFILATGTGVTQTDPGNATYPGPSSLRFDIDLWWNVTTGGFGPLANGYASLAVGGTVGAGGSASAHVKLDWKNQNGATLRTGFDETHPYTLAGSFTDSFTTGRAMNAPTASLPNGSKLHLVGFVEFQASNDGAPSSMNGLRAEFGGTPPTGNYRVNASGSYFNSENWEFPNEGEDGLRVAPSGVGERAVFTSTGGDPIEGGPNGIFFNDNVTLGALEAGGDGSYSFSSGEGPGVHFATTSGNPSINFHGRGFQHSIQAPITFDQPLDLNTDGEVAMGLLGTIGGTSPINKRGGGHANFTANNANFAGGVNVLDGTLRGASFRSLGIGQTLVDGGELQYAVAGASGQGVVVKTGLLRLDAFGTGDHFEIQEGGAIGGNPAVVSTLTVGQQLALQRGAMIVHADPENPQAGNPQNLGNDPLYIYGVSGSVPVADLAVGSDSGTPWVGIGGSRGENSIGDPAKTINVVGSAVLASLPSGSLDVQSHLAGGGGTLSKNGAGAVRLSNSNTYAGPVTVNAGGLLINGSLAANVTVKSGGTAGGNGILIGLLQASEDGSAVSPGDEGTGKLSVKALVLGQNTELDFDLDTPATSDAVLIEGDLVLDGQLFISVADNIGPGRYPIMQFGGSLQNHGLQIASAPGGLQFEVVVEQNRDGFVLANGHDDDDGGTVFLVLVPEPGIMGMLGIGAALLIRRRRNS